MTTRRIPPLGVHITWEEERRPGGKIRVRCRWTQGGERINGPSKTFPKTPNRREEIDRWKQSIYGAKQTRTVAGLTFGGFIEKIGDQWLYHGRQLSPRSCDLYKWTLAARVMPWFSEQDITRIDTREVRRFGRSIEGASSRSDALAVLKRVLNEAVDMRYLERNPCVGAQVERTQRAPRRERTAITLHQLQNLLDALEGIDPEIADALTVCAASALRIGELCALQVRDFDPGNQTLHIERQIGEGKNAQYRPPKYNSIRTTPIILPQAVSILHQRTIKRKPQDLIFTSPMGGRLRPRNMRRATDWSNLVIDLGLPPHFDFHCESTPARALI